MFDFMQLGYAALCGASAILALAGLTWLVSVYKGDVSIVDSVWSLLILLAAVVYALTLPASGPRAAGVLALAALWALRLAVYITWRNWASPKIIAMSRSALAISRTTNSKASTSCSACRACSLRSYRCRCWQRSPARVPSTRSMRSGSRYAWRASLSKQPATGSWHVSRSTRPIEARVMDRGLWRYTRHPNYFGEFCVWWGFFLIALAGGGWWAIVSPLLMSLLLVRVSGVTLLEKDIGERRPEYRDYKARTNAFFPGCRGEVTRDAAGHNYGACSLSDGCYCPCAGGGRAARVGFRAYLDDAPIGYHRFTLREQGDGRELKSESRFEVKVLFVTAYRYAHDATEQWRGNCLESMTARTDDNGDRPTVDAKMENGQLAVIRSGGSLSIGGCVMSFGGTGTRNCCARRVSSMRRPASSRW